MKAIVVLSIEESGGIFVIEVTKKDVDKTKYSLNPSLIARVKSGPGNQAIITMSDEKIYSVEESKEYVEQLIFDYQKKVLSESIKLALDGNDTFGK